MPTKNEIQAFSIMIEQLATEKKLTIMDAIIHYCDKSKLEVEVASTLISHALKSKIQIEAEGLNLLKKKSRLPL